MGAKGKKDFPLSITLLSIDKASLGIERVNKKLDKLNAPTKRLGEALSALGKNAGFDKLKSGFSGIGKELKSIATGIGVVGGVAAGAVIGFKAMTDEFDNLGDTAKRIGFGVDALAQLRDVAVQSDGEIEALDSSLGSFNKNLGQVKAGTGRLTGFLKKTSPALLTQLKHTKSGEEAFRLLANAMAKLKDPAKKAALSAAAGFDETLIPMLSRGGDEIAKMREEFERTHGSVKPAVDAAGQVDDAFKGWSKSLHDVKADIVAGVGPAFADLVTKASGWLSEHREQIAAWAKDFGEKLPGRIQKLIDFIGDIKEAFMPVVNAVRWFVDKVGGAENAVKLLVIAWASFKALKIASSLLEVGQGLFSLARTAKTVGSAIAGGTGFLGWAGGIGLALAAGVGFGMMLDHWLDLSGKLANALMSILGDDAFGQQSEASRNSRARSARLKGKTDAQLLEMSKDSSLSRADRDAAAQERAARSSARDTRPEFKGRPALGAVGLLDKSSAETKLVVKFEDAPMGMRVKTEPGSDADVDVYTGFQMVPK